MEPDPVSAWVETGGVRLSAAATATAPLDELEPLGAVVGDAHVVGLGVPTHGARDLTVLTHWTMRFLVERLGFRAVGMDEGPNVAGPVDTYIQEGAGNARTAVAGLERHHRSVEVLDLVEWMRTLARGTPDDPVRFVGLGPDSQEVQGDDPIAHAEAHMAEMALRWLDDVGSRLVMIAGMTHTAVAPDRTVTIGPRAITHRNAGSRLRGHLGDGYVSLGLTFHHGVVDLGTGPHQIPAPPAHLVESTLGEPSMPVLYDLRTDVAEPVRRWLDTPATLRLVGPAFDPDEPSKALMSGGSLAQWFASLVHVGQVGPVTGLAATDPTST